MRKIIFILALFLSAAIISCSGDSDSDVSVGYIDPGLSSAKQLISNKRYAFSGISGFTDCPASDACGAIIYSGTLSDVAYTGIAAGLDQTNPSFSVKVYWPGSITNTTGVNTTYSNATIKINSSTYTGNIILNITTNTTTANDSSTVTYYTIVFKNSTPISVGSYTINDGDIIIAYKY